MTKRHHRLLTRRRLFTCLALLFLIATSLNGAALYKWIDETGQVRYSDQLPPQQVRKEHQTLNAQGVVTGSKKAAKTQQEIDAENQAKAESDARAALEKEKADAQFKKDQVLLLTFSSVEELTRVKDNRIEVVESVIRLINSSIETTTERLDRLKNSAETNYTAKGIEIPGGLAQNIEFFTRKITNRQEQLVQKEAEKRKINQQFEIDVARFRLLKGQ